MLINLRRLVVVMLCTGVLLLCGLSAIGEVTGNKGLWTLGGEVGMARATIACISMLAVAILLLATGNGSGPFRPLTGGE